MPNKKVHSKNEIPLPNVSTHYNNYNTVNSF